MRLIASLALIAVSATPAWPRESREREYVGSEAEEYILNCLRRRARPLVGKVVFLSSSFTGRR